MCPGFPHPSPPPQSAVAIATHQEAPSCVGACDHNFITAYKRQLCAYCVDEVCLNIDFDHVARAGRNVFEELRSSDSAHHFCVDNMLYFVLTICLILPLNALSYPAVCTKL